MNISFAPPYVDEDVENEVIDCLRTGWITTGPKTRALEVLLAEFTGVPKVACVNSWTSGAILMLHWLGVGPGDEVIIPAYTYAATALAVMHVGATPVMVDITPDFTINADEVRKAINSKTKAILSVDFAGWPCNFSELASIIREPGITELFTANNPVQQKFGRPVLISDAAHSLGADYNGKPAAMASDITIFSLHAVKNVTTAEGGAICLNLPEPFDIEEEYRIIKLHTLNGQTKDAFTKSQGGNWRYDIVLQGFKFNMPDICAAIGLAQLKKYSGVLLPERKRVFDHYQAFFSGKSWAVTPPANDGQRSSSYHLYAIRIKGATESQRDAIIQQLAEAGIAANVHFIPLPMLSLFKEKGYDIKNYPVAYANYANEISLPIYPQLTNEQCSYIEEQLNKAVNTIMVEEHATA